MLRLFLVGSLLILAGCSGGRSTAGSGSADAVECAPFARQVSGIALYGDAASWWEQAQGRYPRSAAPSAGGVLVFQRSARLPAGHVSVVARLVSDREIRVTQANWVHHRITRDEPIVDVSPGNDWSQVRVWWDPVRGLGNTVYRAYGFIIPTNARSRGDLLAGVAEP